MTLPRINATQNALMDALDDGALTLQDIADQLKCTFETARSNLKYLRDHGLIEPFGWDQGYRDRGKPARLWALARTKLTGDKQ